MWGGSVGEKMPVAREVSKHHTLVAHCVVLMGFRLQLLSH